MGSRVLLSILDFVPPPPTKKSGVVIGERGGGGGGGSYIKQLNPSIIVIALILTIVFLVSASLHLLLRFLERWRSGRAAELEAMEAQLHHLFHQNAIPVTSPSLQQSLIDSLPVFTFDTVIGIQHQATDCAVCLSRFQAHDQLRLLPKCSHAFHANCVDSWLLTNSTCPLCRAEVVGDASEKSLAVHGMSFRLELGSLSRRRDGEMSTTNSSTTSTTPTTDNNNNGGRGRSYSMGSFEYVVDSGDGEVFVKASPRHRQTFSDVMVTPAPEKEESDSVAAEESGGGSGRGWGGNWLKEYVDKLTSSASSSFSSRSLSFRSGSESGQSGSFFL